MVANESTSFFAPLKGKVLAAFMLAIVAIALAVTITYFSFDGLLDKVDELSAPNNKLQTLGNLFEQITRLDQQQRADAIKNPGKSYRALVRDSKRLLSTIDSLQAMGWEDTLQLQRLESMKRVLRKRDFLLVEYLKLRAGFLHDKKFSRQLDSLADLLVQNKPTADSSVVTTQKKTTTTTYLPETEEKKRSFFSKLFGSKKKDTAANRVEVKEEISIKTDTVAVSKQDSAITKVGRIMKNLDEGQRMQTQQMAKRELDLISTHITLINQLLSILRDVENEEIAAIEKKNAEAASLVNHSIQRIGLVMIVFFLLAAILVFLILVDISKSNYYRLQLIHAKEEAEQLSQVKQRFLANMSHEIRTPLQSIIGFSDQLKNPSLQTEAIHAIQSSSEHLLHIVNEVLDFSRIESDTFTIEQSTFDLATVIDEVAAVIRIQAQQKAIDFIVATSGLSQQKVVGDPFRLRQILYNLLGNALKFTHQGFVRFETNVDVGKSVKCKFIITDTGIGIAEEDIARVFAQFEQGHAGTHRQYGGAGLGLSIVKKLVDLQQGKIEVRSTLGAGSIFSVMLDFKKASVTTSKKTDLKPETMRKPFSGRVLLVDDDPLILRLCSLLLAHQHIPFVAIQQPEKVLNENLNDVHFIFLDIRMPGISGVDLCRELRKKTTHTRIIALTAHVLPQEQASILESGFDQILSKPFREKDFMDVLGIDAAHQDHEAPSRIDLSALRKMTMGDEALLQSIVEQFIEETTANIADLKNKLQTKNTKGAREIIHQLAGRIGQFGVPALSNTFHLIEIDLDARTDVDQLNEKISSALAELNIVVIEIQQLVGVKKVE